MFIGTAFLFFGIGALCVLICRLAADALPAFVGFTVGFWAYGADAGAVGAIFVALLADVGTLHAASFLLDWTRYRPVRLLIMALFAAPATLAGYQIVLALGRLTVPSEAWQHAFAGAGALIIGLTEAVWLSGASRARVFAPARDESGIS